MKTVKISEARKKLFQLANEVADGGEEYVLSRRGKKDVVLVDYGRWSCVREAAARYSARNRRPKSMRGSIIIKTKNLDAEIRKIREEFTASIHEHATLDD